MDSNRRIEVENADIRTRFESWRVSRDHWTSRGTSFFDRIRREFPEEFEKMMEDVAFLGPPPTTSLEEEELVYCYCRGLTSRPRCPTCLVNLPFRRARSGYANACSVKCAARNPARKEKTVETSLKRYGTCHSSQNSGVKEKLRRTFQERFGTDHPMRSEDVKESAKKRRRERTGFEHPWSDPDIREKCRRTTLERHGFEQAFADPDTRERIRRGWMEHLGVDNPFKSKEVMEKARETLMEKSGFDHPQKDPVISARTVASRHLTTFESLERLSGQAIPLFSAEEFDGCTHEKKYRWRCSECGEEFLAGYADGRIGPCSNCAKKYESSGERELRRKVEEIVEEPVVSRERGIVSGSNGRPLELDIFVPSRRFAVEFDGLYWHGEARGARRMQHSEKTEACSKVGVRLVHVFEDEWTSRRKVVLSRLRSILGKNRFSVGARKLEIREITTGLKRDFVEKHHIQGDCGSAVNLGAFLRGKLCAVMTFGKRRRMLGSKDCPSTEWELLRFCTVGNFSFPGLASRMLRRFETTCFWRKITSYCDRRWGTGDSYTKMGFVLDHVSPPCYWYVKGGRRFHRAGFMKHTLSKRLEKFDPEKTEWENMRDNGWDRIWDCGNLVFVKTSCSTSPE